MCYSKQLNNLFFDNKKSYIHFNYLNVFSVTYTRTKFEFGLVPGVGEGKLKNNNNTHSKQCRLRVVIHIRAQKCIYYCSTSR